MMEQIEIDQLKQRLELQRLEVLHFVRRLEQETRSIDVDDPQDVADRCVSSISRESLFERSSQSRTLLRLIEAALRRVTDGSFGECTGCGDDIPNRRLQALPWTQFCLKCQQVIEEEVGASLSSHTPVATATLWRRAV